MFSPVLAIFALIRSWIVILGSLTKADRVSTLPGNIFPGVLRQFWAQPAVDVRLTSPALRNMPLFRDRFFRDIGTREIQRVCSRHLHGKIVDEVLEILSPSHKIRFAIHLDEHSQAPPP